MLLNSLPNIVSSPISNVSVVIFNIISIADVIRILAMTNIMLTMMSIGIDNTQMRYDMVFLLENIINEALLDYTHSNRT